MDLATSIVDGVGKLHPRQLSQTSYAQIKSSMHSVSYRARRHYKSIEVTSSPPG